MYALDYNVKIKNVLLNAFCCQKKSLRGTWEAESVNCSILDLSPRLDLRVVSLCPKLDFTLGVELTLKNKKQLPSPPQKSLNYVSFYCQVRNLKGI